MIKNLLKLSFAENKLFFRILLYFLSLLVPIIFVGAIFYSNYTERLKEEFSEKIHLNLVSNAKLIDSYLQSTQETNTGFLLNRDVQDIMLPFDQYTTSGKVQLLKITQALSRTGSISAEFVDQLFVYIDDQKIYTGSGIDDYDTFFKRFYHFDKYDRSFWEQLLHLEQRELNNILEPSVVRTVNSKEIRVIPIIIKDKIKGNNIVMVTTIPVRLIADTLKNNAFIPSTRYMVLDDQNRIILSELHADSSVIDHIGRMFQSEPINTAETSIDGRAFMINYVKSDSFGWSYYAATPVQEIRNQADELLSMLKVICIVLFVISIFISLLFTLNLYSPIKKIRDMLVAKDEALDYRLYKNELELIGSGIHQLIDSNKTLNVLSLEYVRSSFDNLIKGNQVPNESSLEKVLAAKLGFDQENYICCSVKFDFTDRFFQEIDDVDRFIIWHKLNKVLWAIFNRHLKTFVLEYDRHFFVCIMNVEPESRLKLENALSHVREVFKQDMNYCSIVVGIGKEYPGLRGIAKSNGDAMTAIGRRERESGFQVIDANTLTIRHQFYYSFADENKLINCMKTGDWELFEKEFSAIVRQNKENGVSFHSMNLLLQEIHNTGKKFAADRGIATSRFWTDDEEYIISSKVDFPLNDQEKMQLLARYFREMIGCIAEQNENNSSNVVAEIIAFIENNYQNDLYLDKISEQLGLSSRYVSRHFKEKMDMNLTDFISQIRIQKAKRLLQENPDLQIKTVSENVGIYSRMTFLRLFKKYEGVSPNDYKEMLKRGLTDAQ